MKTGMWGLEKMEAWNTSLLSESFGIFFFLCHSASYTTGLIKCKTHCQERALGDMISKVLTSDVHLAAKQLKRMERHNEPLQTNSSAVSFLKSVRASCKVLEHSAEVAKDA